MQHHERLLNPSGVCLITSPELAKTVGRTEAIFLQQLHYWLSSKHPVGNFYLGQRWIYNSYKDWQTQLKIVSVSTIRRVVKKLEQLGLIIACKLNKKRSDQTKWYTINYEAVASLLPKPQENPHMLKMNSSCVQNEQNIYKETEITSENKTISSEEVALKKQEDCPLQVNFVKKESELKNNLAAKLLEIWNQTVGQRGTLTHLTKKRAQHLVAAFKYRFQSSLDQWKNFCQQITTSDFLMGKVRATFKASLDWVLKFDTIQRILEGDFGIRHKGATLDNSLEEKRLKTLKDEIESSGETDEVKGLRREILRKLGTTLYHSWFKDLSIVIDEQGIEVKLQAQSQFVRDWIETNYLNDLRSLTSKDIHIFWGEDCG